VFNFGLPMKAEDYTHRIGRTGRAGRDGLAVTFAEFRDRRKIFDIESYSRQPFKAETIPGLEPQQRFPDSRPRGNFGGRDTDRGGRENHSRDRKFGSARPRFGDKSARSPFSARHDSYQNNSYRGEGVPERGDFATRKPSSGKPVPARLGNGGKVFVPRDARKRPAKPVR
jgi:superfamily II DNA/RNA helicase